MQQKNYIIVKDRHPRFSEVLNDCISLCVPTSKNEPLSSVLQKICNKISENTYTFSNTSTIEFIRNGNNISANVIGGAGGVEIDPIFTASPAFDITTGNISEWNSAYNNEITSASFSGTSTKTLTLNQRDGGTVTANFNDLGSVTSVGLSLPSMFSVSGSPVTTSGILTAALASQSQNLIFASPSGSAGTPAFRALTTLDLPSTSPYNLQKVTELGQTTNRTIVLTGSQGSVETPSPNGVPLSLKLLIAGVGEASIRATGATTNIHDLPMNISSGRFLHNITIPSGTTGLPLSQFFQFSNGSLIQHTDAALFPKIAVLSSTNWGVSGPALGYIEIGSGLSLSAGILSATGGGGGLTDNIYTADGILDSARVVNQDNFSLTFSNSGLFRISQTDGIYDFNNGVDLLTYDGTKSYSYTQQLLTGIKFAANNITASEETFLSIDNNSIILSNENSASGTHFRIADFSAAANGSVLRLVNNTTGQVGWITPSNQTITLSGEVSGTGTTSISTTVSNSAVIAKVLTGYIAGTNTALAATDTILEAFQKTQGQLNAKEPSITAGTTAQYWRGDKTWQTLNNTAVGLGNVPNIDATLRSNHTGTQTASTISDFVSNVRTSISLTTTGTSGAATYNSSTGVLNIPNYATGGGGSSVTSHSFNATTDWGSPSGGYYSHVFTHSLGTNAIIVQIWDDTGTPVNVFPEIIEQTDTNNLTIKVTDAPDNRFAGRIVLIS